MHRLSLLLAMVASIGLVATSGSCKKAGDANNEELAKRVESLEAEVAKFREVETFIRPHIARQKAQADQEAARRPDPSARFAVDISGNPFHGPEGAAVTVIEAFDFA